MGSEGPAAAAAAPVTIHVTGFKKFHGVTENPTETIVSNLEAFMNKRGLPKGLILGSCTILETAGHGALVSLYQTLQSAVSMNADMPNSGSVIWVHFGVNSGATRFALENRAFNEATFRCPDEMGWKPQKVAIVPADGGISRIRETSLPVEDIAKSLAKMGYEVTTSDDAGRFVCNYVYYHSLRFAEQNGIKSVFVHVPLFSTIDEATQMQFVASLLEILVSLYKNALEMKRLVDIPTKFDGDMSFAMLKSQDWECGIANPIATSEVVQKVSPRVVRQLKPT
ncbi:Peptidase C15- pyroglutamyl peptidase I-like [Striga hermonthica]|uniref:Peptidase C15- pyroglutamyl peptidase I-like n=1 Tax=Striga hermonthica TaxID=68872 RepID=A0A9N7N7C0_STRHE|nr:Peptidase C15- pyroglutamyl peptidase I-like [Striga hermonthica]